MDFIDLAAEPGNKLYMNQKAVYKRFSIWTDFFIFFL